MKQKLFFVVITILSACLFSLNYLHNSDDSPYYLMEALADGETESPNLLRGYRMGRVLHQYYIVDGYNIPHYTMAFISCCVTCDNQYTLCDKLGENPDCGTYSSELPSDE